MASGDDPVARPSTASGRSRTRWLILAAASLPTSAAVSTMTTCMVLLRSDDRAPRPETATAGYGGDRLQGVVDLVLECLGLCAEHGLHVVADLDHPGRAERLEAALVDLPLVGDLHAQSGDAGVDVDQVVAAAERRDELLRLAVPGDRGRRRCCQHRGSRRGCDDAAAERHGAPVGQVGTLF